MWSRVFTQPGPKGDIVTRTLVRFGDVRNHRLMRRRLGTVNHTQMKVRRSRASSSLIAVQRPRIGRVRSREARGSLRISHSVRSIELDPMIAGPEGGPSSDMQRYED